MIRFGGPRACVLAVCLALAACGGEEPPAPGEPSARGGAVAGAAGPTQAAPGRPILIVTIDTLRWDALGSYGATTATPALDALAGEGVRFEYAVAHAVVTLPSHASILTGLDPSRHGVHDNDGYRLSEETVTLAERLSAAGYATGAFVGAFPVDSLFGLAQGFDVYDDSYEGEQDGFSLRMVERRADEVVESARGWLEEVRGPWFAWVHVYDPHAPYAPPAPFDALENPYAGEVAWVDSALAPLLQEAREREAIVVVTSDHGEAFGAHGEETHGVFAYAATLRVPLIVAGLPEAPTGEVVAQRVSHVDLVPTLLAAVGEETEAGQLQGRSLYPALRGEAYGDPFGAYFEALTPYLDWGWAPLRGIYEGDLKFIDLPIPEVYDVAADPAELENLADRRASDLHRLSQRLEGHLAGATAPAERVAEDEATLERLRALGYVGSSSLRPDGSEEFGPEDDPKRLIVEGSLMQEAVRAMEGGRLGEAAALLQEVIASRPDLARAWRMLASVRSLQSGPATAAVILEEAAARGAGSPTLLSRLAQYQLEAGRLEEAEATAEAVLATLPEDVEMISLLGSIYGAQGRVAEAEAALRRGLSLDPTYARLHANRGTLMLQTGRLDEAEAAFREALSYDRSIADAHNGLGVVAAQRDGDLAAAVEHWQRALEYSPDQPRVLYNLGYTLARLGRVEPAIAAFERYLELEPDDTDARRILADLRAGR